MQPRSIPNKTAQISFTAFFGALIPVFYCAYAAMLLRDRLHPQYETILMPVLIIGTVYAVPFFVTGMFAQFLNLRFSVRNVIVFSKIAEFAVSVAAAFICAFPNSVPVWFFAIPAFFYGIIYSIWRPALKIYTTQIIPGDDISLCSGFTEASTFGGILAASIIAVIAYDFRASPFCSSVLLPFAAIEALIVSYRLEPVLPYKPRLLFSKLRLEWYRMFKRQPLYRNLVITGIGENYIFASIIFISILAIIYTSKFLHDSDQLTNTYLYVIMTASLFGVIAGCIFAGFFSQKRIELGMVPTAILGMVITTLLISYLPKYSDLYIESGLLALLLFFFGFFGGYMLIPVTAYQKFFIHKMLAPSYFSWFYLPFGFTMLFTMWLAYAMYSSSITLHTVTAALALLTVLLALMTYIFMPQFLLRWLMHIMLKSLYSLRVFNAERIPERGGALLVANRASFVDILFVSAVTSRPIHFMMNTKYYRFWMLYPFVKSVGFIEVAPSKPKHLKQTLQHTAELLAQGELVCMFPEDDITKNGLMSGFREGICALLPKNKDIPVIPVRIGMTWGSIFSCFYGKFRLRMPNELPHPASVTVGLPVDKNISAYELRIKLSELGAETELTVAPNERPFHSQFAKLAKKYPFKSFMQQYDAAGGWKKPYNISLLIKSVVMSRFIRRLCGPDEQYVGVMLPNTCAAFVVIQAIYMADKIPAVMNYTAGAAANEHAVKLADIKHILTSRIFLKKARLEPMPQMVFLEESAEKISRKNTVIAWTLATLLFPARELMKFVAPETWNDVTKTAAIIFSSGSTGIPKGIMLSHHNINANATSVITILGWSKKDVILGNLPIFHSFGFSLGLWLPVITAAASVQIPNPIDASNAVAAMKKCGVTVICATPGFYQLYIRKMKKDELPKLRLAIAGAEKLRNDIADKFRDLTGLEIAEGYGCTELSPVVSVNMANSMMELGIEVAERGTIGPPIPGVCVKIVEPSTFSLLPENTDGLLIVKGANVMQGYMKQPEKTAEVIRDGWYITGDIGKMSKNGFITLTGRISRFSKIAGEMVPHELVEREINSLLLPEDRLLAVCGTADPKKGEKLIVFYTDEKRLAPDEVVRRLREKNIPNLWIPAKENFILVNSLPVLGSGKLDLAKLKQMADALQTPQT